MINVNLIFRDGYAYLRFGIHLEKGSPIYSGGQLQIGLWFTTWHLALRPQLPRHGLIHF